MANLDFKKLKNSKIIENVQSLANLQRKIYCKSTHKRSRAEVAEILEYFRKSLHLSKRQLNKIRRISTISGLGFFQGMVHVSQGGIPSNLSPIVPRKY